jgi:hypothetical protein
MEDLDQCLLVQAFFSRGLPRDPQVLTSSSHFDLMYSDL